MARRPDHHGARKVADEPRGPRGRAGGAARRLVDEAVQEPVPRGQVDPAVRVDRRSSRPEHVLPDRVLPLDRPVGFQGRERAETVEALGVDEVDLSAGAGRGGGPDISLSPEVVSKRPRARLWCRRLWIQAQHRTGILVERGERVVPVARIYHDLPEMRVEGEERRGAGDIGEELGAPLRRQLRSARIRGIDGAEAEPQAHVDRPVVPDDRRHLDLVEPLPHLHGPRRGRDG